MKSQRLTVFIVFVSLFFTSCSIYHPQAVDIPLINHSGDTRIDASFGMSYWLIPSTFTMNATVTHGFNDWFSGQLHANYGGNNFYLQAAPGAYKSLSDNSVVEGFVGVGYGGAWSDNVDATSRSSSNNDYSYEGTFIMPFAQSNFGWHDLTAAHIDLGFGIKVGAFIPDFDYRELNSNGNVITGSEYTYNTTNLFVEPQFLFRIGSRRIKFNVKVGVTWMSDIFKENSQSRNLYSDLVNTSAGFSFAF